MSFNPKLTQWQNKRVWLVGASTGIGEALARQLDQLGCKQMLSARSADKLTTLAGELQHATALPLDITQQTAVQTAFNNVIAAWGGVDLIVLMAGTYSEMSVAEFDIEKVKQQIDVNLNGTMYVLANALPKLLEQKSGHLAIVSSVAGYRGLPNSLAYGPTKAALINLAEALHVELQPHHVGVSVVNPGFVDTPLTRKNTFPMPFLITAEKAAQEIITGLEKGEFEIHFPKAFTRTLRTLRILPYSLYFAAVRKITANKNKAELGHEQIK
ncbi:MAG: SDR family NAD(P)-dependent oxidoreductase [Limnobacter sp.]|jgi:short-subunit dehydrogenase|uniref:SDR family NAD(P)-dependent oxidoreductase n=1 Tax=unclassified Limnobacter TaxID=2630203 RepID=UPI000CF4BB60|nr:SDR family NAD(P)-dependent oxidoreductase [Limnobacter sp. SAORIC-690]PQJ24954.1 short-chain dehydrogenase [Limnobacter sp. SAORIC-690]